ncbi:hypothetical protein Ppb6_01899 [Photorhabdus australis subsp. thailandensis]|uniref:Uncharacterized protein n=1 Tax=Photorhabdus australis subsp. thailandensis TaxID=2805096 RepID=A0A1C0U4P7_9GAMM|nr:hypothetical protein Ppb6_01899 [Photorhabdus australis subsp. thailandensis]
MALGTIVIMHLPLQPVSGTNNLTQRVICPMTGRVLIALVTDKLACRVPRHLFGGVIRIGDLNQLTIITIVITGTFHQGIGDFFQPILPIITPYRGLTRTIRMADKLSLFIPQKLALAPFSVDAPVRSQCVTMHIMVMCGLFQWRSFANQPPEVIVSQCRFCAIRPEDKGEPVGIILVLPAGLVAISISETQLATMRVPFTQTGVAVCILVAIRQAKFIPQDMMVGARAVEAVDEVVCVVEAPHRAGTVMPVGRTGEVRVIVCQPKTSPLAGLLGSDAPQAIFILLPLVITA